MDEQTNEYLSDATAQGLSNCCGAPVYYPDICKDCEEHCAIIAETEED